MRKGDKGECGTRGKSEHSWCDIYNSLTRNSGRLTGGEAAFEDCKQAHQLSLLQLNKAQPHADGSNTQLKSGCFWLAARGRPPLQLLRQALPLEACAPCSGRTAAAATYIMQISSGEDNATSHKLLHDLY